MGRLLVSGRCRNLLLLFLFICNAQLQAQVYTNWNPAKIPNYDNKTDNHGIILDSANNTALSVATENGIYRLGSRNLTFDTLSSREFWRFNPDINEWEQRAVFPSKGEVISIVSMNRKIYALGNIDLNPGSYRLFIYDELSNIWSKMSPSSIPPFLTGTGKLYVCDNKIHMYGRTNQKDTDNWAYTESTNSWRSKNNFNLDISNLLQFFFFKGKHYVFYTTYFSGNPKYTAVNHIFYFNSAANEWQQVLKDSISRSTGYSFVYKDTFYVSSDSVFYRYGDFSKKADIINPANYNSVMRYAKVFVADNRILYNVAAGIVEFDLPSREFTERYRSFYSNKTISNQTAECFFSYRYGNTFVSAKGNKSYTYADGNFFSLNLDSNHMTRLKGLVDTQRFGANSVSLEYNNRFFILSGVKNPKSGISSYGLWELDENNMRLEKFAVLPDVPSTSAVLAAFVLNDTIYYSNNTTRRIYALDLNTKKWTRKADLLKSSKFSTTGLVLGSKVYYFGTQAIPNAVDNVWEYDPFGETWTAKATFPLTYNFPDLISGLVLNNKIYLNSDSCFMVYDSVSNAWTRLASCPESKMTSIRVFEYKGYIYFGSSPWEGATLWRYDTLNNNWTKITTQQHIIRDGMSAFTSGSKAYLFGGRQFSYVTTTEIDAELTNELWEFDKTTDKWKLKSKAPLIARSHAATFTIGNYVYLGTGVSFHETYLSDFWRYDPALDEWKRLADFAGGGCAYGQAFSQNGKGYIIACQTSSSTGRSTELWEYDPGNNTWKKKAPLPALLQKKGMTAFTLGKSYIFNGNAVWCYDAVADQWSKKNDFPGTEKLFNPTAWTMNGFAYLYAGNPKMENEIWRYDPAADSWTRLNDFTGRSRFDALSFTLGDEVYLGFGLASNVQYAQKKLSDLWKCKPAGMITLDAPSLSSSSFSNGMLRAYPNPASKVLNISVDDENTLRSFMIFNVTGQQVMAGNFDADAYTIDISNLPDGIYFLKVEGMDKAVNGLKFIVNGNR